MEIISKLVAKGEVRHAIFNTKKFFPGLWGGMVRSYFCYNNVNACYKPLKVEEYKELEHLLLETEWIEEKSEENCRFHEKRIYVTETENQWGISAREHILNLVEVPTFEVVTNVVAGVSWLKPKSTQPSLFERTKTRRLYLQTGLYHGYEICYNFFYGMVAYPTLKCRDNYVAPGEDVYEIEYWDAISKGYEWIETI